ncbi:MULTISPECIES: NAD(P)-dependent alcohol dehydrogenase [unclassified Streptomyces]|uniref:zinc-dependent alcohol dehydrogenase family protein n=1 Tax=unclassified Streptomyces TaxID=2593676 RepID=UPI001BEC527C|nr:MULTISPECIES: NAD(P)-dependent alcohol dehydrogenase [unclassified Streptomyces]MBT2407997.1 NAD(P)-dependent alcohol dehydrogenase [Streptomyces sp. ISL-21]MBT2613345.1 NAD(P)-dependent alcohol dehydrogenase [Streptomyces sp. ISL-87]
MRAYHLEAFGDIDGIVLREGGGREGGDAPEPVGPTGIVIRLHTASLNRRDLMILHERYPLPAVPGVVPLSDGAGEVVAVGEAVTRFAVGDRVSCAYFPRWRSGRITPDTVDQPGCTLDGMLAEYAVLDEQWAVRVPDHLTWEEAATLPCAGVTAWNALTGGEPLLAGQTVLTLGTGPVSLFAVQFAKLLGCRVVSTTSSEEKAERLRALGADAVVDYTRDPEWGVQVRELTGGLGADLVVETGGPETIGQSVRASALYAQIALLITGSARKSGIEIPHAVYASSLATIRRVFVGSRAQFEDMNLAVTAHGLRPVIGRVHPFEEAHAAYRGYAKDAPFGKVVIRMGS